jgi:hypothetical protein
MLFNYSLDRQNLHDLSNNVWTVRGRSFRGFIAEKERERMQLLLSAAY